MNLQKIVVYSVLLIFLPPLAAEAQLSPGKLAHVHENLEGLRKCGKCHKLGSQEVTGKCLACHNEIKAMQKNKTGLHAGSDYARCVACHVDHQGRTYALIHWPEGMDEFDHQKTGHDLEGAHRKLKCRKCHRADLIKDRSEMLKKQKKNLSRTFLGLESRCASCHQDIHRKQFSNQCTSCHDQNRWKPAAFFTHLNTAFPLTGMHGKVACDKCHKPEKSEEGTPFIRFAGIPYKQCSNCHSDPHKEGFGSDCRRCHDPTGWKIIRGGSFDHDLTRYKLEGRHRTVGCGSCHSGNRKKPDFDRCDSCHRDTHAAGILKRSHLMQCETCHDVQGFQPARYGQTRHMESAFPLLGAHRAVPCQNCHRKQSADQRWTMELSFMVCTSCHIDPHQGRMTPQDKGRGCVACHSPDTWLGGAFDHGLTPFPLMGAHARVACVSCHGSGNKRTDKTRCAQCHTDPHQGQFKNIVLKDQRIIDCARCHVTVDWLAERFNHDTDSRFPLRGGHLKVICTACHQAQSPDNPRLLLYKPLARECASCHREIPGSKEAKE